MNVIPVIDISDDEEQTTWDPLLIHEPVNDLEPMEQGPSSTRPMTFEKTWDSDDESSWFNSDDEPASHRHIVLPASHRAEIRSLVAMVETQMEFAPEADEFDIASTFPEDDSETSGTEHHPLYENDRPAMPTLVPNPELACRQGHVFPDLLSSNRGTFSRSPQIPESPTSPPPHERGPYVPQSNNPQSNQPSDYGEVFVVEPSEDQHRPLQRPVLWYLDPEVDMIANCMICGRSYRQVLHDAAADYLLHTNYTGEPIQQRIAKRDAFVHGMRSRAILSISGGLSQVATCDGNTYEVFTGVAPRNMRGSSNDLPLFGM